MGTRILGFVFVASMALLDLRAQPAPALTGRTVWAPAQDGAMMSPDGRLIAFVDWNFSDVAVREVATGSERRLPEPERTGFPDPYFVFSPNSGALVYPHGNSRDAAPFRYELRRIDVKTGAHDALAVFGPEIELVVPLAWHADAGLLFNKLAADGASELVLLNPANKNARVLHRRAAGAGLAWQAAFTRDGRGVAILANDELLWIDVASGESRLLGVPAQILFGWSADERALLIHDRRGDVTGNWSVAISQGRAAGAPALLQRTAAGVRHGGRTADAMHYVEPVASPGLFLSAIDLAAGRVSAPEPILPAEDSIEGNPAWSRDGTRLAFTRGVANRNSNRVFVVDGPRGTPREIAKVDLRVTGLDWSADGKSLIIGGRWDSRQNAWIGRIDVATGAIEKHVTGMPALAVAAGAGDEVVFTRSALTGSREVHLMHARGRAAPRVLATYTTNDVPRSLSVSPDGKWIAMLKAMPETRSTALMLLPGAGGEPRIVAQLQRPDLIELNQGRMPWTADGQRVLVMMRRQGQRQLAAVRVDSGEIVALPFSPPEGGWSLALHPDGRQLVYVGGSRRDELKAMPR